MKNAKKLSYTAMFTALVCVLTLFTHIPLPIANGRYVHLGDAAIFIAGVICGGLPAAFAAGVGSAFADILGGAAQWAVPTLIVKALMGYAVGAIANNEKYFSARNIAAMLVGGLIMSVGYVVSEIFIFGISPIAEILTAHFYVIQFASGMAAAAAMFAALDKTGVRLTVYKRVGNRCDIINERKK